MPAALSKRSSSIPASPIRKFAPLVEQAKKEGVHIYHLNIGDPDTKTPEVMLDVLHRWDKNPIPYTNSQGHPDLLKAFASYYQKTGYFFVREEHIQVTTGGSEAIFMALYAITDPGDEVIVFEPFYTGYNGYGAIDQVKFVPITTVIENGYHLPPSEEIERHISPKTKAILICSPNNPTGTVYTKKEMDMLVSIAKKHQLYILSDEVYREYAYDGITQVSLFSYMQEIPELAIVLDSVSKRYSLCGARVGTIVSLNATFMNVALRMAQARLCTGVIDQLLASVLDQVPDSYIRDMQEEYKKRRNTLYEGLLTIPGVTVHKPEGSFYMMVKLPIASAEDFVTYLLTTFRDANETVMVTPAEGFYATTGYGKDEIRIAYVLHVDALIRSVELLRKALIAYQEKNTIVQ